MNQILKEWCDVSQWFGCDPNGQTVKAALRTILADDFPPTMNSDKCTTAFAPWLQYISFADKKVHARGSQYKTYSTLIYYHLFYCLFS